MYRFIDEYTVTKWEEKYVILNGKQISYPSPELLLQAGIKPLIEDDVVPVYDEATQMLIEYYEDAATAIIKHKRVEDIPSIEEAIEDEQIEDA